MWCECKCGVSAMFRVGMGVCGSGRGLRALQVVMIGRMRSDRRDTCAGGGTARCCVGIPGCNADRGHSYRPGSGRGSDPTREGRSWNLLSQAAPETQGKQSLQIRLKGENLLQTE